MQTIVARSGKKSKESSEIIEHYKSRRSPKHQAVIEPLPVVTRRFSDTFEKIQSFVVSNRLEEKPGVESESNLKESKKVSSSISYASVVLNNFQNSDVSQVAINNFEIINEPCILEGNLKTSETSLESNKSSSDSIETLDTFDIPSDFSSTIVYSNSCSKSILSQELTSDSVLLDSNESSFDSIEACTGSDVLQESLNKFETPLNAINELNNLINKRSTQSVSLESKSNSELNNSEKYSESSSICVLDYQEDYEREEQKVIEDLLGLNLVESNLNQNSVEETLSLIPEYISKELNVLETEKVQNTIGLQRTEENQICSEKNVSQVFAVNRTIHTDKNLTENHTIKSEEVSHLKTTLKEKNCSNSCECVREKVTSRLNLDTMKQTRVLTLNNKEHQECTLYRLEKNWTLQFRIGPSLFGRKVFLYCNYPVNDSSFIRDKYYLIPWELDKGCKNADDTASLADVPVKVAGSFHYFFTFSEG